MTGIGQANFLQSLGWAVLNSLWQMAFLWVIYQLITGIFRSARPGAKSSLASLLLITGFAWFIYTFIAVFTSHVADGSLTLSAFVNREGNQPLNNWLQQTLPVASVLYLTLLLFPFLHLIRNYRYVQVIRRYGLEKIDAQWRLFVKKVAAQMNIKKPVHIWVSEFVSSPVTIGFFKPVILVPLAVINHLTPQQLEAVLLHELSHIKRYDYLINLIINFIQTILYFNPFVKAFVKIVEREREKSCDEMVMQFQYDSHEYATALLLLEKTNYVHKPLALAASGKKNDLLHRVELIMGVTKKPSVSFNKLAGLLAGLLCVIVLNALLIMGKPLNGKQPASFAHLSSPFSFFTGGSPGKKTVKEKPSTVALNPAAPVKVKQLPGKAIPVRTISTTAATDFVNANLAYMQAGFVAPEEPHLKKYQEQQVQDAVEASKKVLKETQWKTIEKGIADVFKQQEKDELKADYQQEIDKFDWNKLENKLRLAYDKVDWNRMNDQLTKAVNQIRVDSLFSVCNEAISKLNIVHRELALNNLDGIPDTDITLKTLEEKKQEVQKTLNSLRVVRSKKIVHL